MNNGTNGPSCDSFFVADSSSAGSSPLDWEDWVPEKRKITSFYIRYDGAIYNAYTDYHADEGIQQRPALIQSI